MEIRPLRAALIHTDRRTEVTSLIALLALCERP